MAGSGISNLRPWPKGVSGNPGGAPKLPPEIRAARRENMQALIKLIHLYVGLTSEQALERLQGPDSLQLEEMVQGLIGKSKEGDVNAFKFLIEVMCGKIPEADEEPGALDKMSEAEKLSMLKMAVAHLEGQIK